MSFRTKVIRKFLYIKKIWSNHAIRRLLPSELFSQNTPNLRKLDILEEFLFKHLPIEVNFDHYSIPWRQYFLECMRGGHGAICGGHALIAAHLLNFIGIPAIDANFGIVKNGATHVVVLVKPFISAGGGEIERGIYIFDSYMGLKYIHNGKRATLYDCFENADNIIITDDIRNNHRMRGMIYDPIRPLMIGVNPYEDAEMVALCKTCDFKNLKSTGYKLRPFNSRVFLNFITQRFYYILKTHYPWSPLMHYISLPLGFGVENQNLYDEIIDIYTKRGISIPWTAHAHH